MPRYDFKCQVCETRFEIVQSMFDASPTCPGCGGHTEKLISAPAVKMRQYFATVEQERAGRPTVQNKPQRSAIFESDVVRKETKKKKRK